MHIVIFDFKICNNIHYVGYKDNYEYGLSSSKFNTTDGYTVYNAIQYMYLKLLVLVQS